VSGDAGSHLRQVYEAGRLYQTDTICAHPDHDSPEYVRRQLWEKIDMVRRHRQPGLLVDLCCATGAHLREIAGPEDEALGVDFSAPFLERARADGAAAGLGHLRFALADAKALPLGEGAVATLYSFSALYVIPDVETVIAEIARVLRPGGRCVLDLGNAHSLNTYCVKHYTEWPPSFHVPLPRILTMLARHELAILEHRAFQLLPLWAARPRHLWPLLHPVWKTIMAQRVRGRMLDEWISSAPLLRRFAFRHLIACERRR
jgi:SAM-dependent methyltransferase